MHAMLVKQAGIYFAESENTKEEAVPWEVILQHATQNLHGIVLLLLQAH